MIADFGAVIDSYSSQFTKITVNKFTYSGITYDDTSTSSTVNGLMLPITTEDREELIALGHSPIGKQSFYTSGSEDLLTENDIIVDSNNVEWVTLADGGKLIDWREHGNYVKYILTRKILPDG